LSVRERKRAATQAAGLCFDCSRKDFSAV
jgi:hypothetical protein